MANKLSILVADDDKQLISTISEHLSNDYDVTTAFDGREAISILKNQKFNLIILDLKMPHINGYKIIEFVKKNTPESKVIILTGYANLQTATLCKKLGADEVIKKPFELEELFDIIDNSLKK